APKGRLTSHVDGWPCAPDCRQTTTKPPDPEGVEGPRSFVRSLRTNLLLDVVLVAVERPAAVAAELLAALAVQGEAGGEAVAVRGVHGPDDAVTLVPLLGAGRGVGPDDSTCCDGHDLSSLSV